MKKEYIFLLGCAVIFIFCSIGLYYAAFNTTTAHEDIDSTSYIALAKDFAGIGSPYSVHILDGMPVTAIGYPLFLSMVYAVFGYTYVWVILIQMCMCLLAGFLLYTTALRIFDQRVALITAALFSIHLGFLIFAQFILTDIVLATLLIAGFERLVAFFKNQNFYTLSQAALLYGVSVIIKPVALFYIFFIVPFLFFLMEAPRFIRLKAIFLYALIFYSIVFGYMAWNKVHYNTWVVAPLMNQNLYMYFLPKLIAEHEYMSIPEARQKITTLLDNKTLNDYSRWNKPKQMLMKFLRERPILVAKIWLINMLKTLLGLYTNQVKFLVNPDLKGQETSFFQKKGTLFQRVSLYLFEGAPSYWLYIVIIFQTVWMIVYYCLIGIAVSYLTHKKRYALLALFGMSIAYFVFITGPEGYARYRMMSEGFLLIFAAFGLDRIWDYLKQKGILCTMKY